MAPCIQLHRFLQLQDKERTHLFTFLVENPHEISTFDVRSREFHFAGHRWYVYTGKPNNEYFSFYLRIVNLGKDVRVHTVYSFNVINLVNCQNNYIYYSPPGGRVFSRNDDALSWGWKEFIRRETLLKPNGGFLFDGNKALVELECKSYKTVIEETIQLPVLSPNHPFPMVHTSPFSVGGFAWQIRIFPDGPDEDNKGNVALFLHCTTANHLVKVKARFLIEGQPSPVVYEHTFPANCISEMPSGVAFPNRSEFMKSLTDHKLRVGIEFVAVTEVNEVHVTLSEPTSYPTVCVTPFEDLSGCPWVLKTLQASKLKLKLDQNEKTTTGLMEFYHRHVIWNATLVAPSSDDCSMNISLNTKGSLIGYFGENWSDADVIKSEISIEDLTVDDNLYRTDVDDGYDRYSYISLHVEVLSNHLLYKTPAPSPTGDRERKLLYNARKDRSQLHNKYQELLRHKAALESKCQNLERERSRLGFNNKGGMDEGQKEEIVPDFTKLLFDLLSDLSRRATLKNRQPSVEITDRPYRPPVTNEKEINKKFQEYRNDFSLLVRDSKLKSSKFSTLHQQVEEIHQNIVEYIETKSGIRITKTVISGSIGTDTCCTNRADVDFHIFSPNLPRNGHVMWLPSLIVGLKILLQDGFNEGKIPHLSQFSHSSYSVQMLAHGEIEIDIYPSYDWQHQINDVTSTTSSTPPSSGGYDAFYEELLRQRTSENLCWFSPDAAELQKSFILEQPEQVKTLIRVVKQWRNGVDWKETKWRPPSYLLILLMIRAYENASHDTSLPSYRVVLRYFIKLVLSTSSHKPARMRISWSRFYDPDDYNIEYSGSDSRDSPPIIQDPANPANNVAERPISWIPFRRNLQLWANRLHLTKDSVASDNRKPTCDNHDDGETLAIIQCHDCGKLCAECDRFLHLNRKTRQHQRQVFKEEEESIRVDLHEGCGRLKLFWFLALADSRTLKAVVEFKSRDIDGRNKQQYPVTSSTVSGSCRFCGTRNESIALTSVCADVTCQQLASVACSRTLSCGHHCGGVKNEEKCLQCLHQSCTSGLKQDADDMCMICFTDNLSAAPSIKLDCGHIFHFLCYETMLKKKWSGPRITFRFMNCSICKTEVSHVSLEKYLAPLRELKKEVEAKALQRLEYEGLIDCESISSPRSKFYKKPLLFALDKYAYYVCHKCSKAYYGGDVRCDVEANLNEENFDSSELICGACSNVSCAQICAKHGTDFLEYKCRYCCSVAVYFCFGTTHFCRVCHDDFQRIVNVAKEELPSCPAGPGARQLDGSECPLHLQHPPTGQEFALGCGVCRNAHTF